MYVRHLDGDPGNNSLTNLAYGTPSQNLLDSVAHGTHPHASKTHCRSGHPYDATNTRIDAKGKRVCRTCRNAQKRAARARRRITA